MKSQHYHKYDLMRYPQISNSRFVKLFNFFPFLSKLWRCNPWFTVTGELNYFINDTLNLIPEWGVELCSACLTRRNDAVLSTPWATHVGPWWPELELPAPPLGTDRPKRASPPVEVNRYFATEWRTSEWFWFWKIEIFPLSSFILGFCDISNI